MLRHDGFEYGYLLEGELEVTFGFETFMLHAGEALGLNSSVPICSATSAPPRPGESGSSAAARN